jgi:hypothetical protein
MFTTKFLPPGFYEIRSFVVLFTKSRHWNLSYAYFIQSASSLTISVRDMLILSFRQSRMAQILTGVCRKVSYVFLFVMFPPITSTYRLCSSFLYYCALRMPNNCPTIPTLATPSPCVFVRGLSGFCFFQVCTLFSSCRFPWIYNLSHQQTLSLLPDPVPLSRLDFQHVCTTVYPKVSGLAACSKNCKVYSSLPLGAVVSLFRESV